MSLSPETLARQFAERFPADPPGATPAPAPAEPTAPAMPAGDSARAAAAPAAAPTLPSPVAPPPFPGCVVVDFALRGVHLDAAVRPAQVVEAARWMDANGFGMDAVTGLDWIAQGQMEVVYDYFHPTAPWRVAVRTRVPRENPELPTISGVFAGANWHERETHDFFGIRFLDHPDLSPLLLPEDADFHPLKKDFSA
jgi:NADH-quinone oxidoreductase subunit C